MSTVSKARRAREGARTRQRILQAAREMFVREGFEATTMRAIADRIEYTPTAIYHHFESKEALFAELCARDYGALTLAFRRLGRVEDPVERLHRLAAAYVAFALEHPMHYRLMLLTPPAPGTSDPSCRPAADPSQDAYAFLRDAVNDAMDSGRLRPDFSDPDEVSQMIWGAMHGIVAIHIAKEHEAWLELRDPRATAARAVEALLGGLQREED